MKGEHTLRPSSADERDLSADERERIERDGGFEEAFGSDEAPTEEELREAQALADALERGDDPLARALRVASTPRALGSEDHEVLLARALGDEEAPALDAERRAAEALRDWLEAPREQPEASFEGEAALVGALRAANRPAPLLELRNEALIARALGRHRRATPRRVIPVTMAALSSLAAAAAAVALLLVQQADAPSASAPLSSAAIPVELIPSRSTAELFDPASPFPREGGETARIDRIATARAADLRSNRYAAWGVR
ncbi:hypothetical protein [Chondromyces crocatus]|uniref:Uncharacterized protein n=1 Tax=Chondromyces crocatus TaxID=52 RepID=A0A0K1EFU0_CHOCO|nr:hypothetical protein [Chondromyces crocatus]AKT39735.1 uncharacterized protein CMC5_038840 [Chondromyces crocatus]